MPATYEPIQTVTASGSTTTIQFTSIPSTYTDLVIVVNGAVNTTTNLNLRFNSDSGANYSSTRLDGDGTTATSTRTSGSQMTISYMLSTGRNANIIQIMNYANSTTYKTAISRTNNAATGGGTQACVGLWRSTSSITQIDLISNTYTSGSTFTLYGIKAA